GWCAPSCGARSAPGTNRRRSPPGLRISRSLTAPDAGFPGSARPGPSDLPPWSAAAAPSSHHFAAPSALKCSRRRSRPCPARTHPSRFSAYRRYIGSLSLAQVEYTVGNREVLSVDSIGTVRPAKTMPPHIVVFMYIFFVQNLLNTARAIQGIL